MQDEFTIVGGNDHLRLMILQALTCVPRQIVDRAKRDCAFEVRAAAAMSEDEAFHLFGRATGGRSLIALSEVLVDQDEQTVTEKILHEIAHFAMNHKGSGDLLEHANQEIQATLLVQAWTGERSRLG